MVFAPAGSTFGLCQWPDYEQQQEQSDREACSNTARAAYTVFITYVEPSKANDVLWQ